MLCAFCQGEPSIPYYSIDEAGAVVCGGCGRTIGLYNEVRERAREYVLGQAARGLNVCCSCGAVVDVNDVSRYGDSFCPLCRSVMLLQARDVVITVKLHFDLTGRGRDEFHVTARNRHNGSALRWGVPVKLGAGNE
jgi:hypothetical protein